MCDSDLIIYNNKLKLINALANNTKVVIKINNNNKYYLIDNIRHINYQKMLQ